MMSLLECADLELGCPGVDLLLPQCPPHHGQLVVVVDHQVAFHPPPAHQLLRVETGIADRYRLSTVKL